MCRVNQALEPGRVAAMFVGSSPVPHLSGASKPTLVQNYPLMSAYLLVRPDRIRLRYHFLPKALIEAKRPAPHCCAKRQQLCAYATQLLGRFIDMGPVQSQLDCSAQYMQKKPEGDQFSICLYPFAGPWHVLPCPRSHRHHRTQARRHTYRSYTTC